MRFFIIKCVFVSLCFIYTNLTGLNKEIIMVAVKVLNLFEAFLYKYCGYTLHKVSK